MYQPIRNKNRPWQSCLLTFLMKLANLYKVPSIDAPYQILIHLAKRFQRRRFLMYQPIRNKNYPWRPCLLTDCDEMRKLYKGPYIDAPCKILIQAVLEEKNFSISVNQKKRIACRSMFVYGSERNEETL